VTTYRTRAYATDDDYARMRRLVIDVYARGGPPVYFTLGDLDWWRATDDDPDAITAVRLWEDETGDLLGFAWPGAEQIDLVTHPAHRALEAEMLAWAEQRSRDPRPVGDAPRQFIAWAADADAPRTTLLRGAGYEPSDVNLVAHTRGLDDVPDPPTLPPGYRLSDMAHESDLERRVAVHRDAFAPSRMTVEKHRRVMGTPTYRPDLDLVVIAPDDAFAAYCIVWLDAENRLGLFEPVGCHSAHRRRGLASAVLAEGMRRLAALGAATAYVNSLGDAVPANGLYTACGFAALDRIRAWRKLV
jgi:ribosomal protein S18 acetylase RimI-like enzyme